MDQPFKRPSLREAARRGASPNLQAQANPQPAAPPPAAPAKPATRTEQVQARCGHAVPFELYPDGKDKFRESRRKHVTDRDCPECRQKAHQERTAAEMEAGRLRRAAKPQPDAQIKDRLPHGSRFDGLVWDADKGEWSGTLTVPDPAAEGGARTFAATARGVFRLLRILDDMYRKSLTASAAPPAEGPAG